MRTQPTVLAVLLPVLLVPLAAGSLWGQDLDRPAPERPSLADDNPRRPQQGDLSYRYIPSYPWHYDRDNIASLTGGAMDLVHLAMQDQERDPMLLRIAKYGVSGWLDAIFSTIGHEYGHVSSISKAGRVDPVMAALGDPASRFTSADPATMFLNDVGRDSRLVVSVTDADWQQIEQAFAGKPEEFTRYRAAMEAGGLNQEQALALRFSDRYLAGRLSRLDTWSLLWENLATIRYPVRTPESDLDDYVARLREVGTRTSTTLIKEISAVRFLSGSAVAAMYGLYEGVLTPRGGFVPVMAIEAAPGVRVAWPEFESFLTETGPTLKGGVPVLFPGFTLVPSLEERIGAGSNRTELGFRASVPILPFLSVRSSVFSNGAQGRWMEGQLELRPVPWAAIVAGYFYGHGYSFHRDIFGSGNDLLEATERSPLVGFSVNYSF